MKIGELSRTTGVSVRSLRYYEQQGLISPQRQENGYREYSPFAVDEVRTIRFYLDLGLSTEEIASFLHCVLIHKEAFCKEIMPIYRNKLAELDRQIELLSRIRGNLEERIEAMMQENPDIQEELPCP